MKESDKYLKIVEWSEEDNCYVGRIPGLIYGGVHGKNQAKVYAELCQVADEAIEIYKEQGKSLPPQTAKKNFSGRIPLRISSEMHENIFIRSLKEGVSINKFIQKKLESV